MKHLKLPLLLLGWGFCQIASADSILEFTFSEAGDKTGRPQPVTIKDGKILVSGVGKDGRMDVLYSSIPEQLSIFDHNRHTVTTLDENQLNRLAKQTETVQPLLQGLGEQVAKLNPKQRAKWEEMLGGKVSLDKLAAAAKPPETANLVKSGKDKSIAGYSCKEMSLFQGKKKTVELCMADPARLNMSDSDYAAIRSLLHFSERINAKTNGLAKQFGISIPSLQVGDLAGVPVELRNVSSQGWGGLTLNRIITSDVSADALKVPTGYQTEQFKLW